MVVDSSYYFGCHPRPTWSNTGLCLVPRRSELAGQGSTVLPLMDVLAYGVGGLVLITAMFYLIFAAGTFLGKGWGWRSGLIAALLNGLLVWGVLSDGERIAEPIFWARSLCYLYLLPVFSFWATTRFTILMK